jgi:hypothetical protein
MINLEMLIVSLIALAHLTVTGFYYSYLWNINGLLRFAKMEYKWCVTLPYPSGTLRERERCANANAPYNSDFIDLILAEVDR